MRRFALPWFVATSLFATLILAGCTGKPAFGPAPEVRGPAPALIPAGTTPPSTTPPSPSSTPPPAAPEESATGSGLQPVYFLRGIGLPVDTRDEAAKGRKVVVLSFDDGPRRETTPKVLDILKRYDVKAMFFVTGYGVRDNADLLMRMAREGHAIGTHTVTHANLRGLNREQMLREITPVNEEVEKVTRERVKYFRPPFGAYDQAVLEVLKELNLQIITWTTGSLDWQTKDPATVTRNVLDHVYPGAVVLLHDTHEHTVEALPGIIEGLRAKGYAFVILR